jgi:hypothetical protein
LIIAERRYRKRRVLESAGRRIRRCAGTDRKKVYPRGAIPHDPGAASRGYHVIPVWAKGRRNAVPSPAQQSADTAAQADRQAGTIDGG